MLVNYIYRCGIWWEVGKLTCMVAALPREKISSPVFFLSGVDRYVVPITLISLKMEIIVLGP